MNVRVPVLLILALTACAGGDDAGDEADPPTERCDRGVNTAAFNEATHLVDRIEGHSHAMQAGEVDFTVREWAEVFVDPTLGGGSVDQVTEAIEGNPDMKSIILGGLIADTLDPDPWVPLTDPEACEALAAELTRAREAAARYPTAADALADGYTAGSVYVPGKGAHFSKSANIADGFDPDHPDMLMYDSLEPDGQLMGMSYFVISPDGVGEDEGFTGASDQWHSHDANCTDDAGVAIPPTECDAGRGNLMTGMNGWMLHAWVVPGCESDWGVFSGTNPVLPSLPPGGSPLTSGCNTGKTVADPLTMDEGGDGPQIA
jgi:hypothetical protein